MNRFTKISIAVTFGLIPCTAAMAQTTSKAQFIADKSRIAAEHQAVRTACQRFAGNARDICKAEANGGEKIAQAALAANYQPSATATYKLQIAKANAGYAVAREKCDDHAGNEKDVCIVEANSLKVATSSDARARLKASNADQIALRKESAARSEAVERRVAAADSSSAEKRDAEFLVAREKCAAFAGESRESCVKQARLRFGPL